MRRLTGVRVSWLLLTAVAASCAPTGGSTAPIDDDTSFTGPFAVAITGYDDHAMEPFLTRDGQYLLFNDRNAPADSTDLHIAVRVDDSTFAYVGPLDSLNGATLDAVPTGAADGTLAFVSLRAYDSTFSTLFTSTLSGATAGAPSRLTSISTGGGGLLDFDVDLSADGQELIVARGRFTGAALPVEADLLLYRRAGAGFSTAPDGAAMFAALNSSALEFAPAMTATGLELCFTRLVPGREPILMVSRRTTTSAVWGAPRRIRGPTGLVEAGTWSPDGRILYFHALVNGRYVIRRLLR